jgi:hypothetical protein
MKEVFNLTSSLFNHAANKFKKADEIIKNERLSICYNCDKFENSKCKECGCYLEIKASWDSEKCPLNKW